LSGRQAFRSAARLTGRPPIPDEYRFVQWMQSERETDKKERSFQGTPYPMIARRSTTKPRVVVPPLTCSDWWTCGHPMAHSEPRFTNKARRPTVKHASHVTFSFKCGTPVRPRTYSHYPLIWHPCELCSPRPSNAFIRRTTARRSRFTSVRCHFDQERGCWGSCRVAHDAPISGASGARDG